jgi:hypothetical protein
MSLGWTARVNAAPGALPAVETVWYHNPFTDSDWAVSMDVAPRWLGGNNSVVECDLAKVEVAGSNPVSRSNFSSAGPCTSAARFIS